MSSGHPLVRVYRSALVALPKQVRSGYGEQMLMAFQDVVRSQAGVRKLLSALAMTGELLLAGLRERLAEIPTALGSFKRFGAGNGPARTVRGLLRSPAFTVVTVLTVAVGVGANAAVFSMLKGVFLEPLPYADPSEVVYGTMVFRGEHGSRPLPASGPEFMEYRAQTRALEDIAGYWTGGSNMGGIESPVRIDRISATHNLLSVLGVQPALGRMFTPEEDLPDGDRVALISHALWQAAFAGDPEVVGREIQLDDRTTTIIGVLPAGFRMPSNRTDVLLPGRIDPANPGRRASHYLTMIGRLGDGVSIESANEEIAYLEENWTATYSGRSHVPNAGHTIDLQSVRDRAFGDVTTAVTAISVAVLLVLIVASVNVANLMYVRADQRASEIAVRRALGAPRAALLFDGLAEVVVLSLIAGATGLAVATAVHESLVSFAPESVKLLDPSIDMSVVGFGLAAAFLVSLCGAIVPLWKSATSDVRSVLSNDSAASAGGRSRTSLRGVMIGFESALAVVLVGLAALLGRSLGALLDNEIGLDPDGVVVADIALPVATYSEEHSATRFFEELRLRMLQTPGVVEAGVIRSLPLRSTPGFETITLTGAVSGPNDGGHWNAQFQQASAGYFETLAVPVEEGRGILDTDQEGSVPVAVINRTMADQFWPEGNAIGSTIQFGFYDGNPNPRMAVVGIVGDIRQSGVDTDVIAQFYAPRSQTASFADGYFARRATIVVESELSEGEVFSRMRRVIHQLDPNVPVFGTGSMDDVVSASLGNRRFASTLLSVFCRGGCRTGRSRYLRDRSVLGGPPSPGDRATPGVG